MFAALTVIAATAVLYAVVARLVAVNPTGFVNAQGAGRYATVSVAAPARAAVETVPANDGRLLAA